MKNISNKSTPHQQTSKRLLWGGLMLLWQVLMRLAMVAVVAVCCYFFAFASTMGPTIAPHIIDGALDMYIRLGTILLAMLTALAVAIWLLLVPLIQYLLQRR